MTKYEKMQNEACKRRAELVREQVGLFAYIIFSKNKLAANYNEWSMEFEVVMWN